MFCAAGQNRTDDASLFQASGLSHHPSRVREIRGWALVRDYCWDSLASLYTFQETNTLLGLARDCPIGFSPNSPSFSHGPLPDQAPKISGLRSTTELPRLSYALINIKAAEERAYVEISLLALPKLK